jgi:hypothetical protein
LLNFSCYDKILHIMPNVPSKISQERGGIPPVEGEESFLKAIETVKRLINEEGERLDTSLIGRPAPTQHPANLSPQNTSSTQSSDDPFSQLISTGYRPSQQVRSNLVDFSSGPTFLARTWLSLLLLRLLRIRKYTHPSTPTSQ